MLLSSSPASPESIAATGPFQRYAFPSAPRKQVRVGIIGAGVFAQGSHFAAIRYLQQQAWPVEVAAICDCNPARLAESKPLFPQARLLPEADALFSLGPFDAVLILTPPQANDALVEKAVQWRIPFFIEKPVVPTLAQLLHLDKIATELQLKAQVGYNRRFQPAAQPLRTALQQNPQLDHIQARMWRKARTEPLFYHDTLVHLLDFLLWLAGPLSVEAVSAERRRPDTGLHEVLQISLLTAEGKPVHVDVRPCAGRSIESVEATTKAETYFVSYHKPDDGLESAEFSICREGVRDRQFYLPKETTDVNAMNLARGFTGQLASFFRLVAGEHSVPACSLSEAAACLRLRDDILRRAESPTG